MTDANNKRAANMPELSRRLTGGTLPAAIFAELDGVAPSMRFMLAHALWVFIAG